jgi:nicotinamidase-related amidase
VTAVNTPTYDKSITALVVVDPYNDFISEGGKIWPHIKAVAEANDCVPNMVKVLNAARAAKLRVFYAMHHRYRAGDYETWKYVAPIQRGSWQRKSFEYGTWGSEFRAEFVPAPGEIVAQEHWCSSGFANTDLDLQLKKHGIHKFIVIGLIAHTCIEATVRYADYQSDHCIDLGSQRDGGRTNLMRPGEYCRRALSLEDGGEWGDANERTNGEARRRRERFQTADGGRSPRHWSRAKM